MQEFVLQVTGMMCPHCEANVKKCLEALPEIVQAVPNHQENKVVIQANSNLNLEEVKQAICKAGYQVLD
ncbi:MAG: heavy-metal-associated domain-containing protein [Oscillospiraceae bacterium]|nr:heavy-metal-associated domain-containing protein [Oscillospiraceae bacterium]MDE6657480.1 heavy-metal-associated domain-containing protein [Oscillospiraceae bacterium]